MCISYAGSVPTFLLWVQQNKHGYKSFLRKKQKWSAAMSPQTHAVDWRHGNNSSNKKIQSSVHQPNDAEASTSSQSAEEQRRSGEEPISGAVVPLTDDAESREDARWGSDAGGPGYWSSRGTRDVCGRKRAPATGQRRTFMVSEEMRRREEKREERVSTWVTDFGSGWRTCVKSLVGLFR